MKREAKFWTSRQDPDVLTCSDIDEAVQEFVDDWYDSIDPVPETVTIYGYAPMVVHWTPERLATYTLNDIIENLDEEYGNPDEATQPTPDMKAAALNLAEIVLRDYSPRSCEKVEQRVVRVKDYVEV